MLKNWILQLALLFLYGNYLCLWLYQLTVVLILSIWLQHRPSNMIQLSLKSIYSSVRRHYTKHFFTLEVLISFVNYAQGACDEASDRSERAFVQQLLTSPGGDNNNEVFFSFVGFFINTSNAKSGRM